MSNFFSISMSNSRFRFQSAVCRFTDKSITLFDENRVVRTLYSVQRPTGIIHLGAKHPNLFAVTEWNQLTIWDDRVMEKSGCTQRVIPGLEPLYALCRGNTAQSGHLLAYGGGARAVTIYDVARMSNVAHWTGALKYDIISLNFSSTNPKHVFASGLDSEVAGGDWETSGADRFDGLRVESRWIGQTVHTPTNSLVGVTQDGFAYVIRGAANLIVASGKLDRKRQLAPSDQPSNPKAKKRQKRSESVSNTGAPSESSEPVAPASE